MTKIVTAAAVLRLAEGRKLDLDAPADEYFRGFKVVSQPVPVTVRQLLNHSSGLANPLPIRWVRPADAPDSDHSAFVGRLLAKHRKLKSVPDERASYSNLGYLVLGEVISEVTGASYEEHVRKEILSPRNDPHRVLLPGARSRRRRCHWLPAPVATSHPAPQGGVAEGRGGASTR